MITQATVRRRLIHARLLATVTFGMGIYNVVSSVTPALMIRFARLSSVLPLSVENGSRLATAFAGFALIVLAGNLWRQKRVAWVITLITLVIASATHLLKGLDYEEALAGLALATWLALAKDSFFAASDEPSFRHGVVALLQATVFTLAYGVIGFTLLRQRHHLPPDVLQSLRLTIRTFTELTTTPFGVSTRFARLFASSISVIGVGTFGYALLTLLRPVLVFEPATRWERARAAAIAAQHGEHGLATINLLHDKSYFFSAGGSFIGFVVYKGVALALGDPVGPAIDRRACIELFLAECRSNDWLPVFYQTLPDHLNDYESFGLRSIGVGEDAVINTQTFTLDGSAMKPLRAPVAKLERLGYQVSVLEPPHTPWLMHQLRTVSDEWLQVMGSREKRFSLGWFTDSYVQSTPVVVLRDELGLVVAFASLVEVPNRSELTIDLMRRSNRTPSGGMDALFVHLIQWAREHGYQRVNLGLSPLANVGTSVDDPTIERALKFMYRHLNQFYNFQGVHAFKDKFRPDMEPRYLVTTNLSQMVRIATALIRADTGDDWIWHYLGIGLKELRGAQAEHERQ